jgi:hypothetical protein
MKKNPDHSHDSFWKRAKKYHEKVIVIPFEKEQENIMKKYCDFLLKKSKKVSWKSIVASNAKKHNEP